MNTLDPVTWNGVFKEKTSGYDEEWIKVLRKKIKNGEELKPITIRKWHKSEMLCDGHHRLEACRREKALCPFEFVCEGDSEGEGYPKSYKGRRPYKPEQIKSSKTPPENPWRIKARKLREKMPIKGKKKAKRIKDVKAE
jgi:hypothetical protein